ncbi:oligosaccharide flippase family protein [Candidatus Njordibacter sp. Uisw_002]|uniref:oligosaccharide flippase family protein n=1 Tax=Candidatus Njordibacter sp. Uisw_002 TaxID=3230971 RepID=UPI003D556A21
MGGAAILSMFFGLLKTKYAALLFGAYGVGMIGGFAAVMGVASAIATLGIPASSVRKLAKAHLIDDYTEVGRIAVTLKRACVVSGLISMLILMLMSNNLSQVTFQTDKYGIDICIIALAIFFMNLGLGNIALLQGLRKVADVARVTVFTAFIGTLVTIILYHSIGERAIAPALACVALLQLGFSELLVRKLSLEKVYVSWVHSSVEAASLSRLGFSIMFSALSASGVSYITVLLISREYGLASVGINNAAFALSGMFVGFILNAMSTDYYPRLSEQVGNNRAMNSQVNEQTEIGILLSLPGLLGTLIFAPQLVDIFYSEQFQPAVELIQLFILGCFSRIIAWPIGFVMLALDRAKLFLVTEVLFFSLQIVIIYYFLHFFNLSGVALAYAIIFLLLIFWNFLVARRLTGFSWEVGPLKLMLLSLSVILLVLFIIKLDAYSSDILLFLILLGTSSFCLFEISKRLGSEHALSKFLRRIFCQRL